MFTTQYTANRFIRFAALTAIVGMIGSAAPSYSQDAPAPDEYVAKTTANPMVPAMRVGPALRSAWPAFAGAPARD